MNFNQLLKDRNLKIQGATTDENFEIKNLRSTYLMKQRIFHHRTNSYTAEQNGLCESVNRIVVEKDRCFIFDASLKIKFWAEAVNLRNKFVLTEINNKTSYEDRTSQKSNLSHLLLFESKSWYMFEMCHKS